MCTVDHLKAENLVIALGAPHRVGGRGIRRSNPLSRPPEKLVSVTSSSTAKSWSPWLASRRSPPATARRAVERGALLDSPCAGVKPPSRAVVRDRMLSANEPVNDKAIELIRADAERAGSDPAGVQLLPHRTFHDRRRTAASHMARLGIALPVIEKLLAHTSGSFGGIVGVYQRYEFVAEKRAAIEAWGKWLTGPRADAADNDDALRAVVP
jgi:Phage integrase family